MILKSIYPEIDISKFHNQTVTNLLWNRYQKWKSAVALECGLTGKQYTYDDCYNLSRGLSASLIKIGVKNQDICGFLAPNCCELVIGVLAAWDAGCIVSLINPSLEKDALIARIKFLNLKHIIVHHTLLSLLDDLNDHQHVLESIIVINNDSDVNHGYHQFENMCRENFSNETLQTDGLVKIANIGNTSGTTGLSKSMMHTHENFIASLLQFTTDDIMDFPSFEEGRKQPVIIGMLPMFHLYGLFFTTIYSLHQGAKVVIIPKYEPNLYIKLLNLHKPTVLHLVSPLVEYLTNSTEVNLDAYENCTHIFVGFRNFSLTHKIVDAFQQKVGRKIPFQEGYGLSEAMLAVLRNPSICHKLGSVGRILPSTLLKVVDLKTRELLGPNQPGEICIRGPQVSLGYFQNPEATTKLFDSDGFLISGDYGYYNEEQCFFIIDRLVDLIKVGEHYVSPTELETTLRKHASISDVVIVGVPDKAGGEVPQAHVVKQPGAEITESEILVFFKNEVKESFKQLTGGVVFTDCIPHGPTGKTLRGEVRKQNCTK